MQDMVGYIPKDLYDNFIANKALYDKAGKPYPMHYISIAGINYQIAYTDPYTIIGYSDNQNNQVETPAIVPTPAQISQYFDGIIPASDIVPPVLTPIVYPSSQPAATPGVPYSPSNPYIAPATPTVSPATSTVLPATSTVLPASTVSSLTGGMAGVAILVGAALLLGRKKKKK